MGKSTIGDAGVHIFMDARVYNAKTLSASNMIYLFNEIIRVLDMKALDEPKVYEVPVDPEILERVKRTGKFEDEGGTSAIQVISTSHITIHAWPLQNFVSADAFSCKYFDAEKALEIIRKIMDIKSENTLVVKRRKPSEDSIERSVKYYEI